MVYDIAANQNTPLVWLPKLAIEVKFTSPKTLTVLQPPCDVIAKWSIICGVSLFIAALGWCDPDPGGPIHIQRE